MKKRGVFQTEDLGYQAWQRRSVSQKIPMASGGAEEGIFGGLEKWRDGLE